MKRTLLTLSLMLPAAAFAQTPVTFPGGASSVQETFQDWQVSCSIRNETRLCSLSQQQRHKDNSQLVLALDLAPAAKDGVAGQLVLPFGLKLADGVTLQIDAGTPFQPLAFSTCLPAGCVVPVAFNAATVKALRSATALKLATTASDTPDRLEFAVSLKGFAGALDRAKTLGAP